jgi:transcriptional regulator with XRE-family HTH domain
VGVHRTFMSTVERGLSNVSLETLERIAAGLGARAGDLLLEAEHADASSDQPGDAGNADSETGSIGHDVTPNETSRGA